MVPVCDKRYHIYNRLRHFWAEIKKLWNYPLYLTFYKLHVRSVLDNLWLISTFYTYHLIILMKQLTDLSTARLTPWPLKYSIAELNLYYTIKYLLLHLNIYLTNNETRSCCYIFALVGLTSEKRLAWQTKWIKMLFWAGCRLVNSWDCHKNPRLLKWNVDSFLLLFQNFLIYIKLR